MKIACKFAYKLDTLCDFWARDLLGISVLQIVIVVAGYLVTILLSGFLVRFFVGRPPVEKQESSGRESKSGIDVGTLIGKCENIITITFILAGEITGLSLVFAAKSLIRADSIKRDPRYYLGGTLINFSFSVIMGYLIRIAVRAS